MRLAARRDCFKRRNVFPHHHDLRTGQLLDQGITFLMVTVRVRSEQNPDVCEFEPELSDRLLDRADVPLVRTVDENVPFRRRDEERTERSGPNVVDVADHLVRRKRRRLIRLGAHVASQDGSRGVRLPANCDDGLIGRLPALSESHTRENGERDGGQDDTRRGRNNASMSGFTPIGKLPRVNGRCFGCWSSIVGIRLAGWNGQEVPVLPPQEFPDVDDLAHMVRKVRQ